MDAGLLLQYLLIALAVIVSALVVLRKQAPRAERALRGVMALWLLRPQRGAALQRLGRWIAPAPRAGGGCSGCDSCGDGGKPPR